MVLVRSTIWGVGGGLGILPQENDPIKEPLQIVSFKILLSNKYIVVAKEI